MALPPIRSLSHLSFPLLTSPSTLLKAGGVAPLPSLLDSTEGWECGGSNHRMPQWWQHGGLVVALPSLAPTSQSGRQRPSPPVPSQIRSEEGGPQRRCGGLMAALQSPSSHILDPADGGPPLPSHPAGGGGRGGGWRRHGGLMAALPSPSFHLPDPADGGPPIPSQVWPEGEGGGMALPSPPSPSQNPNPRSGWRRRAATGKGGGGGFFFVC